MTKGRFRQNLKYHARFLSDERQEEVVVFPPGFGAEPQLKQSILWGRSSPPFRKEPYPRVPRYQRIGPKIQRPYIVAHEPTIGSCCFPQPQLSKRNLKKPQNKKKIYNLGYRKPEISNLQNPEISNLV